MSSETSIYAELKEAEDFPSPKGVALEIMRSVEREDTSMVDLARLIEKDPAISARLLRTANSPLNGAPVKITTVRDAAARLGMGAVQAIALAFSLLSDNRSGACATFDYDRFWSDALARAAAMRRTATRVNLIAPDEAFTYGLLATIGRLGLVSVFPARYENVLKKLEAQDDMLPEDAEFDEFGIRPDKLSAMMMNGWGMRRYYGAIGTPDAASDDNRFGAMMRLASAISAVMLDPDPTPDLLREFARTATTELDFDAGELSVVFDEVREDWRVAGRELGVPTRNVPTLKEIFAVVKATATTWRAPASDAEAPPRRLPVARGKVGNHASNRSRFDVDDRPDR